ncbi:hypothetical protein AMTR_s00099p00021350 [Amborella trichopoda]|uniref:MULE transposase domain-containing protein n=1 Tax=Amborella trichopoda TaxID=13333 RepID=W1NVL5_AMBTC|nr:hypothetical protein AMTR_s00099p00021350 [Amborella trichopoda]
MVTSGVRLLVRHGGYFESNQDDRRAYYKEGNLKATLYNGDNSLQQLKAHMGSILSFDPSCLKFMYQEEDKPMDLVDLIDDGDVMCMLMVASNVYICVANQTSQPNLVEHQPFNHTSAPSTRDSCPSVQVNVPTTSNIAAEHESESEGEPVAERDVDMVPRLTIVSDCQKGLQTAIQRVFPGSYPAHCMHHLVDNFRRKWKNTVFVKKFWNAAGALSTKGFEEEMLKIKEIDEGAYQWIME